MFKNSFTLFGIVWFHMLMRVYYIHFAVLSFEYSSIYQLVIF